MYHNDNGVFTDKAIELGIDATFAYDSVFGTSWSGLFLDVEFDGDLDLFVSKGNVAVMVPKTAISDRNQFYINDNGNFVNSSQNSGLNDRISHRGAIVFDYDRDGDLDIISSVVKVPWAAFANVEQKIKVFRNDTDAGAYVGIELIGEDDVNRDAFGCKVTFEHDGKKTVFEVDGGSGQASQSSRIIYFGIGDDKRLDKVTVDWGTDTIDNYLKLRSGFVYQMRIGGKANKKD